MSYDEMKSSFWVMVVTLPAALYYANAFYMEVIELKKEVQNLKYSNRVLRSKLTHYEDSQDD